MKWFAQILFAVGLCLAALGGARNGKQHVQYRQAVGVEGYAASGAEPAVPEALVPVRDGNSLTRGESVYELPGPAQRASEWFDAGGSMWMMGLLMLVAGALLSRKQAHQAAIEGGEGQVDFGDAVRAIWAAVNEKLEEGGDPRELLDALQADWIEPVVAGRQRLVLRHGMGTFAEYFGPFSAAERQLHRAWSATTDGYTAEAVASMRSSLDSLTEALRAFEQAEVRHGSVSSTTLPEGS